MMRSETLAKGLSGENWRDFVDELEAHWRQLVGSSTGILRRGR